MYIAPWERQDLFNGEGAIKCAYNLTFKQFQNTVTDLRRVFRLEEHIFLDTLIFCINAYIK
jgi:hypothetical protein